MKMPSPAELADCMAQLRNIPTATDGGLVPLGAARLWFTMRMNPYWRRLDERQDLRLLGFDPQKMSAHQCIGLMDAETRIHNGLRPIAQALTTRFGAAGQSLGFNVHGTRACLTGADWKHGTYLSPADMLRFLRRLFRNLSDARKEWPRISSKDPIWAVEWEESVTRWYVPGCCPDDAVQRLEVLATALNCPLRMPPREGVIITLDEKRHAPAPVKGE